MKRRLPVLLLALAGLAPALADAQIQHYALVPPSSASALAVSQIFKLSDGSVLDLGGSLTLGADGVAASPDGSGFYLAGSDGMVRYVSRTTGAVSLLASLGTPLAAIAASPDATKLYVTQNPAGVGQVVIVDVETGSIDATIPTPLGTQVSDIAVSSDGTRAYMLVPSSASVWPLDLASRTFLPAPLTASALVSAIALSPDGRYVYATGYDTGTSTGHLSTWDTTDPGLAPVHDQPVVGAVLGALAITADGRYAFVSDETAGQLHKIDLSAHTIVESIAGPVMPSRVGVTDDGTRVVSGGGLLLAGQINIYTNPPFSPALALERSVPAPASSRFGRFISPNIIESLTTAPAPLEMLDVNGEATLTALGFGRFLPFKYGIVKLTGHLTTDRQLHLMEPGGAIVPNGFDAVFTGSISGKGMFQVEGAGSVHVQGRTFHDETVVGGGGRLMLDSSHAGSILVRNGTLILKAKVGDTLTTQTALVALGAAGDPATTVGVQGGTLGAATMLLLDVFVDTDGTVTCDRLRGGQTITLNQPTLNLMLQGSVAPTVGATCTIVSDTAGSFAGIAQGATITVGGHPFEISYTGGNGHDITLTALANNPPTNGAPTIAIVGATDETIQEGDLPTARALLVGDDLTPVGSLTLTGTSSNQALVPDAAIGFSGMSASRTVIAYPEPGVTGQATLTLTVSDGTRTASTSYTLTVLPNTITYHLAEGATGAFFRTDLLIVNPSAQPVPARLEFTTVTGALVTQDVTLDPLSRRTIRLNDITGLESTTFATRVLSLNGARLAVERTMSWDAAAYGAHTEKATQAAGRKQYFAEGAQGFFKTYFLLQNAGEQTNVARMTFLLEGGGRVERERELPSHGRVTVDAGDVLELAGRAFSTVVTFQHPGLAERSMYFGTTPFLAGGSGAAGVAKPSSEWYLAEGATGSFFSTYLLVMNPNDEPAEATFTFMRETGGVIVTVTRTIPGNSRVTIDPAEEDVAVAATTFATTVTSDRDLVVERSMYWPKQEWTESHASAGEPDLDYAWALAEGRVGGADGAQTFVLLSNPGDHEASVELRFVRDAAEHGGQPQTPIQKTVPVPAHGRVTVAVTGPDSDVPALMDETFGVVIDSNRPITVERSIYSSPNGATWSSGTNAAGTRLFGRGPV